jgi:DNA invertase Pin-like site-specific DNA recombinase
LFAISKTSISLTAINPTTVISMSKAAESPKAAMVGERPRAYSYIRFSTPDQAHGDSLRRQTEAARDYAKRHKLEFDETLDLTDPGISAHYGKNVEVGKLRAFLDGVRDGIIPQGSYLLVESLDRISRQTVRKAVRTMEEIVESGVNLVDLSDNGKVYSAATLDNDHGVSFMMMALRFMRAHEESAIKSSRLAAAYARKRRDAAARTENGKPFSRMLPAWLTWREDTKCYLPIPERAEVVQSIFQMADAGIGQHSIAQRLNVQGVSTFGGHGRQRKAEAWHKSYIKKLLTNSAVVGTFTPHQKRPDADGKRKRVPLDPVAEYFPIVIERELFERVASRMWATAPKGRNAGVEVKNVFAGVIKCAHCGGTVTRMPKGRWVYLICSKANRKVGCKYQTVQYEAVEGALRENAQTIIQKAPRGLETEALDAEISRWAEGLDVAQSEAQDVADELIRDKSHTLRELLRKKEREMEWTRERLRSLRAKRDTLTKPFVERRLQALGEALTREPFNVVEANKALKEAASKVVLNPEMRELTIYWHHASDQPTEAGPFRSRHYKGDFDDNQAGDGQ